MMKVGKIQYHNNLLCFISEGIIYRLPGELFKSELVGKKVKCEIESNQFRKVVVKVIS